MTIEEDWHTLGVQRLCRIAVMNGLLADCCFAGPTFKTERQQEERHEAI